MILKPKIGLLPLYLTLYDETLPAEREAFTPFLAEVTAALGREGLTVIPAPVCRVAAEVAVAVRGFESAGAELIVTLHLAYSPSLESADVLVRTALPVLMLDTTMDLEFSPDTDPARLMYNHGVHGVQDLASVLRRRGKPVRIVAGHYRKPAVMRRAGGIAQAAAAARHFRQTRALRVGRAFVGMGDFSVDEAVLRDRLGITVTEIAPAALAPQAAALTEQEIRHEMASDIQRYEVTAAAPVLYRTERVALALRRLLDSGGFTAFSLNFQAFASAAEPINTVPFLEASKAMARGMGYAGEGDVLTAALVGACSAGFGKATFTEIFCADWRRQTLFLSHMGEVNPDVLAGRGRILEKPFPFTPAENPAVLVGGLAPGGAVLVNLVPGPADRFGLVLAPVDVLPEPAETRFADTIRGWIRPAIAVAPFLERYSLAGGTHHSALVWGDRLEALEAFAGFNGWSCEIIN